MYNLTAEDLEIQARARTFIDEVIPYEEEAEANAGELPADVVARIEDRARELGLLATNMPAQYGGGGCTMLQQVLVQEQGGRATNALGLVPDHAAVVVPARRHPGADREVRRPGHPGREGGVLRHHRGGRRLRRRRHRLDGPPRRATSTSSTA